ncbi:Lectin-B [Colletotrichum trifolii]|uniref:Lectin-B n=1 Tax=Colletotrichum trifolii TaxID=5466 RepID=A0A4R8R5F7_COLTR|nr:Lectin-B [Colletotrichum trifolii]
MVRTYVAALVLLAGLAAAVVSPDNSCGGSRGYTCPGSLCCSQYNWCGVTDAHCGAGCQRSFGRCTGTSSGSSSITPNGVCGGTNQYTCSGGTFGNCCSQYGYCGNTDQHCLNGCQSAFGDCSSITQGGKSVSTDGLCGGTKGQTCQGSTFGDCCSEWGYCGSSSGHCSGKCQTSFGTCSAGGGAVSSPAGGSRPASSSAARPASSSTSNVRTSPDGSCGGSNGYTCPAGKCCSKTGYCDVGDDFCGFGCQTAFSLGTCQTCPGATCAGTISGNPQCSTNNNQCWTINSKKFQISCGRLASGSYLNAVDATSFGDCISKCGSTAGCVAASYFSRPDTSSCSLLSSYQGPAYGNSAGGQQNHAYVRGASCA